MKDCRLSDRPRRLPPAAMPRRLPALATLCLAVFVAACGTTQPAAEGDELVEGVYVGRFNQAFESTEIVIELRQRGQRLSGTYTLRAGGGVQEGRVTGVFTNRTVQLEFLGMDASAEFIGTSAPDGSAIEGQFDLGAGANYTVTLRRD